MHKIGWDIGGAHLKAVLLSTHNKVEQVLQMPCKLWLGLTELQAAVDNISERFNININDVSHAVTMTGELVDLFPNRKTGVIEISNFIASLLGRNVWFYTSHHYQNKLHFVGIEGIKKYASSIASANWHASANLIARHINTALILDIGSTTTDIIPIIDGKLVDVGFSDASRLQQDSLVYTGVIRTPIMALAQKLMLNGKEVNVAAEYFATMADVYRLTGELAANVDMVDTADGKGKSTMAAARRLARMVGDDINDEGVQNQVEEKWLGLARHCRDIQQKQIQQALIKHWRAGMPVIGVGAGDFLAKSLANQFHYQYLELEDVFDDKTSQSASLCLPALAVGCLLDS